MKKLVSLSAALLLSIVPAFAAGLAADPAAAGTPAPGFTLPSQDNTPVSLSDYKGKWVVLYFYPKDATPGCTKEAHNFQRDLDKFKAANAVVLGVSLDTPGSHKSFCDKESLTFKLLADPEAKVVDAYGVPTRMYGTTKIAMRQTFLIDPSGKIAKTWLDVNAELNDHSTNVLAAIAAGGK
jgi:thioredoxin-dependent peroxiredoxin